MLERNRFLARALGVSAPLWAATGVPIMSGTTDKISGIANEAVGKAKQGIGNVVGSEKLKGEGAAQELKGDAQKAVGDAKNAVKDGANKAADAINKNL
jgi:uncharacterized protein YjbJ (UPF0337 family)